jgi:hypothetical protein
MPKNSKVSKSSSDNHPTNAKIKGTVSNVIRGINLDDIVVDDITTTQQYEQQFKKLDDIYRDIVKEIGEKENERALLVDKLSDLFNGFKHKREQLAQSSDNEVDDVDEPSPPPKEKPVKQKVSNTNSKLKKKVKKAETIQEDSEDDEPKTKPTKTKSKTKTKTKKEAAVSEMVKPKKVKTKTKVKVTDKAATKTKTKTKTKTNVK